ncbi:MAG: glycosyltransferase family 4 protein, partial [Candidatus Omnitrophica bacterium]|nr:glycosyltransferase family 4 protein [Candidatus Omnitrophota bacterium]
LWALLQLNIIFRKEKFDIVHTHTAKAGFLGRLAAHFAKIKIIVHSPHGHNFYGYFNPFLSGLIVLLERFSAKFTDKIIPFTELEKNDFLKYKAAQEEKLKVIYQGIELDKPISYIEKKNEIKSALGIEKNTLVVGMIGRLEPIKGPQYFIDSARIVSKKIPGVKFILTGEGSMRERLLSKVDSGGLRRDFIFRGWQDDVYGILPAFDLLVLPSLNEAVGMILIEAQAMGIPVVASKVGGIPEVLEDGLTGILVPAKNAQKLAEALICLLEDGARRKSMSEAGKGFVCGKFRVSDMVNSFAGLYSELLTAKTR